MTDGDRLPAGTVTFLMSDIEGSTRLWAEHAEEMGRAVARHDDILVEAISREGGVVVKTRGEGDSAFAVFDRANDAAAAAVRVQRALAIEEWPAGLRVRVRMAVHTGDAELRGGDYFGLAVNRGARLKSVAHGGQVLVSQATADLVCDSLPPETYMIDLGVHRLRDLARPERISQLCHPDLESEFPPLASLEGVPNNLPVRLTSFVGREEELRDVTQLLSPSRLMTLTGAAGCGKTRLALEVASLSLAEHPDGVWVVELGVLAEPRLLPEAVASVLEVREEPGRLLRDTLAGYLRTRRTLLVLDNCEHIVVACAALSQELLQSCPGLTILTTSREALAVAGEVAWRVPSLALPREERVTVDDLSRAAATRLFCERAVAVHRALVITDEDANSVARICRRLDGIPLAIELAAARTNVLSVSQVAARLDDRFRLLTGGARSGLPRQQTLRAAVEWSHDLLTPSEQVLLRRLSVFAGSFGLGALEAICAGGDVEAGAVLDLLGQLVAKSLVVADTDRDAAAYHMLETIRQYAGERLFDAGEGADLRAAHRDWYMALAERADDELHGPNQAEWLDRLEQEHENLRAALEWSLSEPGGAEAALRLAVSLGQPGGLWMVRGHWSESRVWLDAAMGAGHVPSSLRARASTCAGAFALRQGDMDRAHALLEEGQNLASGDKHVLLETLRWQGLVAVSRDDHVAARSLFEESLVLAHETGDRRAIGNCLSDLGSLTRREGDTRTSRQYFLEALEIAREIGDRSREAVSLCRLGEVATFQGDYVEAGSSFEAALPMARSLAGKLTISHAQYGLAELARRRGELQTARTFHEDNLDIARDLGSMKLYGREDLRGLGETARMRADYEQARALIAESLETTRALGSRSELGQALRSLGLLLLDEGATDAARPHLEESLRIARDTGTEEDIEAALHAVGCLERVAGHADFARELYEEALARAARSGSTPGRAASLHGLGLATQSSDRVAAALRLRHQLGEPLGMAECLEALASLASDDARAARLLGAAEALRDAVGCPVPVSERSLYERRVTRARSTLGDRAFRLTWNKGRDLSPDEVVAQASDTSSRSSSLQ